MSLLRCCTENPVHAGDLERMARPAGVAHKGLGRRLCCVQAEKEGGVLLLLWAGSSRNHCSLTDKEHTGQIGSPQGWPHESCPRCAASWSLLSSLHCWPPPKSHLGQEAFLWCTDQALCSRRQTAACHVCSLGVLACRPQHHVDMPSGSPGNPPVCRQIFPPLLCHLDGMAALGPPVPAIPPGWSQHSARTPT